MPKGPRGEKRPADVIGTAIRVARIATGEETEALQKKGEPGGKARAKALPQKVRKEIARKAAKARWEAEEIPTQEETS